MNGMNLRTHRWKGTQGGFTLIELLISVALFVVVMMVSVGTLLSLVDANRQAQSLKSVTNNLNFALDSMMRSLRTGYNYSCGGGDCSSGGTSITFRDDRDCQVTYSYVGAPTNGISRTIANTSDNSNCNPTTNLRITAPDVIINDMRFYVTGSTAGDTSQPFVTIVIKGTAGGSDTDAAFNIQTSATQRVLDL